MFGTAGHPLEKVWPWQWWCSWWSDCYKFM